MGKALDELERLVVKPTAGSEPPAGSSRRRSLPALAKVRARAEDMRSKALSRMEKASQSRALEDHALMRERVWVLSIVLGWLVEVEREEPEGNTQGQSVGA